MGFEVAVEIILNICHVVVVVIVGTVQGAAARGILSSLVLSIPGRKGSSVGVTRRLRRNGADFFVFVEVVVVVVFIFVVRR